MSKQNQLVELARTGASGGGNKNLIINGAMAIAQRGTSSTTDSYKTVDRFRNNIGGPSVTQTQETLTSGDPYDLGFRHFYRQTNTSASSATSSNVQIFQIIEAQDIASSGWNYTSPSSYISVSFWVRSSLAGTYPVCFRTYDGTSYWHASEFTIAANTWTKITKKVSGNSNLQFDNDNGAGLQVNVSPHFDTDFTDSSFVFDQWAAYNGSSRSKDYAQDWGNTVNATFDITGVQVEVGEKATDFEHRTFADELARCQRYFAKSGSIGSPEEWYAGVATYSGVGARNAINLKSTNDRAWVTEQFPVLMRAIPTVTFYPARAAISQTAGSISQYNANTAVTTSTKPLAATDALYAYFLGTSSDNSSGYTYQYYAEAEL